MQLRQRQHAGPTPRVWGVPVTAHHRPRHPRHTPTCVGKTSSGPSAVSIPWTDPHARGEETAGPGKSVRRRGADPTRIGKSVGPSVRRRLGRTDPHVSEEDSPGRSGAPSPGTMNPYECGENSMGRFSSRAIRDRPPRVWGGRIQCVRHHGESGSNNPHTRGEGTPLVSRLSGEGMNPSQPRPAVGLTPTRVWTAKPCKHATTTPWTDPHACGEVVCLVVVIMIQKGAPLSL